MADPVQCYNCQLAAGINATDLVTEFASCHGINGSVSIGSITTATSSVAATSATTVPSSSSAKSNSGSSSTSTAIAHSGAGSVAVNLGLLGMLVGLTGVIFGH